MTMIKIYNRAPLFPVWFNNNNNNNSKKSTLTVPHRNV